MPTKQELLEEKTKADLLKLADKAGVTTVKKNMRKSELVAALAKSRNVKKADL
jgi:hypothetical protein